MTDNLDILNVAASLVVPDGSPSTSRQRLFGSACLAPPLLSPNPSRISRRDSKSPCTAGKAT